MSQFYRKLEFIAYLVTTSYRYFDAKELDAVLQGGLHEIPLVNSIVTKEVNQKARKKNEN